MTAGVVVTLIPNRFRCAFPGRKAPGLWLLEYEPKGFPGAHGSRHLHNMMGGEVYEVDFLFAREFGGRRDLPPHELMLALPSKEKGMRSKIH